MVGRGVLLDLPRFLGAPWLDDGTRILPDDLDACAEAFGVAIDSGDILLVRTGMLTRCLARALVGRAIAAAPRRASRCTARAGSTSASRGGRSDTGASRCCPPRRPTASQPLHMISLRDTGLLLGEIFHLDALAQACAEDGRYAFLFAAPPLPITGAVGRRSTRSRSARAFSSPRDGVACW